jgi:aminopeptidase N
MLSNHLGQEIFLKGVGDYLKIHAYGNARTNDLWAALSAASGQDVRAFMDPWIRKIGYPVVTVAEEPGQISIRQSRYLTTGDVKTQEDETTWWVPVGLKTGSPAKVVHSALTQKEDTVRDVDDAFYKINADQSGFYRTNYPPKRLAKLGEAQARLSMEDKIGLLGDATALAMSGEGTTAALLTLLEGFKDEKNYLVWQQITSSLAVVKRVFAGNKEISDGLTKFTLKLVTPAAEAIGWDFPKDEDHLTGQARKLLLGTAASAGHQGIVSEGQKKFAAWKSGDEKAIHPNLRNVIFNLAVAHGGQEEYDAIKAEFKKTTSVDGKEICLQALGRSKEPNHAWDLLDFVTSEEVAAQDAHSGAAAVSNNNDTRFVFWEYTQQNWDRIFKRLSVTGVLIDRWIKMSLPKFSDLEIRDQIDKFFKDKETGQFSRSLVIAHDSITGNAKYKERDEPQLLEWLKAHGYTS